LLRSTGSCASALRELTARASTPASSLAQPRDFVTACSTRPGSRAISAPSRASAGRVSRLSYQADIGSEPALAALVGLQVLERAALFAAASQVELPDVLVVDQLGLRAVEHDLARLHDVAVAGRVQRHARVLLDQQDGDLQFAIELADDAEHLLHQQRR